MINGKQHIDGHELPRAGLVPRAASPAADLLGKVQVNEYSGTAIRLCWVRGDDAILRAIPV